MSTTFLPNKNVGYPALNDTGWATVADGSFVNIDAAFGGNQVMALGAASGTVGVTATSYNGPYPANVASYVPLSWTLTGSLGASVVLQIPSGVGGQYIINNQCTMGAFTIVVATSGGSTSATLTTGVQVVYSDGVGNVTIATPSLTGFAPLASPTFTGVPAAPTATPGTNTTQLATTAFVATSYAPLASPVLTGSPTAPTQTTGDNSTKLATTAYVTNQIAVSGNATPLAITGGLPTVMTGTNTTASMTVSATIATDITNSVVISAGSASWAVSNGNAINGYAGGTTLPNSSTIHMYVCQGGSGTGTYASTVFGLSAGSAPSGYNSYIRRIFSFTTNSSGSPMAYNSIESYGGGYIAYLISYVTDISANIPNTRTTYTVSVPSGLKLGYIARGYNSSVSPQIVWVFSPDETTPSGIVADMGSTSFATIRVTTNTSSQIAAISSGSNATTVVVRGFEDWRRN